MRSFFVILIFCVIVPVYGQQTFVSQDMTTPTAPWVGTGSYFRKVFKTPDTRVELRGPVKLRDYVVDGKLELSLKNYLDLVMANNTDIEVQRLSLEIPKDAIQRAFGIFDPFVAANFTATRAVNPATNTLQGAAILSTLNQPFSATYRQLLATGTQLTTSFGTTKFSTNDAFQAYNPSYTSGLNFALTQPLMRGRGGYVTRLPITIARSQKKSADLAFEALVQQLLANAENAYWDVIQARERIRVQEQALQLADQALKRARREVELGATSPLEIYQPEQNYATAEINLVQVKYQLTTAEDTLRRQIGADLDPDVRNLPLILTERVDPVVDEKPVDRERMVEAALSKRPDLKSAVETVVGNELQVQQALDGLKPVLNLTGGYTSNGRGGPFFPPGQPGVVVPGGVTDSWGQTFGFDYSTWVMGVTLQLPLRDRNAAANLADSVVNKRLNVLRQRSVEQQIRQDVLVAVSQLENSKASLKLAQVVLDFSIKRADADQKRYDLGVISLFLLLDAQNALTLAQSNVVNQTVLYRRNLLNLQQRVGTLLDDKGIVLQY
jgi:outer membrane protein